MQQEAKKPLVIVIMDGLGIGDKDAGDAVAKARKPNLDKILSEAVSRGRYTTLRTDGAFVGLPDKQMGNSDVGHTTIGAGRIPSDQSLPRINDAISDNILFNDPTFLNTLTTVKKAGGALHLNVLLSDGGVHSHINHAIAAANFIAFEGIKVIVHASLDGRDVSPQSAAQYIDKFRSETDPNYVTIATACGRAYSMDRDKRWSNVELAYDAIMAGKGIITTHLKAAVTADYANQSGTVTDENIQPIILAGYKGVHENDCLLLMNFRADRARELNHALIDPKSVNFKQYFSQSPDLQFAKTSIFSVTAYSDELSQKTSLLLGKEKLVNTLGEVISKAGLRQLRVAETEKFDHVTNFLNGGNGAFPNEDRALQPSPKVPYDQKPEMSAAEVADAVIAGIHSGNYDVIIVNFANADMVGHTGTFSAVVKAVEAVDKGIGRIEQALGNSDMILLADHGNAEQMLDEKGEKKTNHTLNPVIFAITGNSRNIRLDPSIKDGRQAGLADVAPTVLKLLGLDIPKEMTGQPILQITGRVRGRLPEVGKAAA